MLLSLSQSTIHKANIRTLSHISSAIPKNTLGTSSRLTSTSSFPGSTSVSSPPYALTILARNEQCVYDAYQTFTEGFGFLSAWEPKASSVNNNLNNIISGGCYIPSSSSTSSSYIEIITIPDIQWQWNDRPNKLPLKLRLLAYNIGLPSSSSSSSFLPFQPQLFSSLSCIFPSVQENPTRQRISSLLANMNLSNKWTNVFSLPMMGPYINLHSYNTSSTNHTNSSSSSSSSLYLQEIVLGLSNIDLLNTCQTTLESIGSIRNTNFPSLWSIPNNPFLRLLPGNYSAILLNHSSTKNNNQNQQSIIEQEESRKEFLSTLEKYAQTKLLLSSSSSSSIFASYGEKKGTYGSKQTIIKLPTLHGLDIRLNDITMDKQILPCFNEPPETMNEAIDPDLNPDADDPSRNVSMGCPSVVAMEVKSTMRLRLGLLK